MADNTPTETAHAVIRPLLLPRRRSEMRDEDGKLLGVQVADDAIEVYDKSGNPLGHRVDPGQEIRAVQSPGDTVVLPAALGAKLVKAGVVAAPGAEDVEQQIHDAWGQDTFDAESLT